MSLKVTVFNWILLVLLTFCGYAQTGKIKGKLIDEADNLSLAGANIYIESLMIGTSTDVNGDFKLLKIAPGTYQLMVDYMGYNPHSETVIVQADNITIVNITLSSGVISGDEVLVVGERLKGQAKALNQQKTNLNITNIVSSDQVGRFPDANMGDALKRIPAITVNYDQGEARYVNVRGTDPGLNSVLVNGERMPSAEGESRAVQMDLIPSETIQTVEVSKAVTPDMDADAIGGAINLVTRQSPNGLRVSGTAGSGYGFLREEPIFLGSFVIGQRFADDKMGLVLSGSAFNNKFGSDNTEGEWKSKDGATPYAKEWDVRTYHVQRLRQSFSGALDYQFSPTSTVYFKSMYNHRNDWENRFRLRYKLGTPDSITGQQNAEIRRQTKGGIGNDEVDNRRLEKQITHSSSLSGNHLLGNLKIDWLAGYAKASEERPNERLISWREENVPVTPNLRDLEAPQFSYSAVHDSLFELKEITEEHQLTEEENINFRLNLEFPLGDNQTTLKFGGKYKAKDKFRDNNFFEYSPKSGFENLTKADIIDATIADFQAGDYKSGNFTTPEFLGALDLENSTLFDKESVLKEYIPLNYDATEDVIAGYAMLSKIFQEKLQIVAGLRIENTEVTYNSFQFDEEAAPGSQVSIRSGSDSYANILPGLHLKYQILSDYILRFAWTNTLARPKYYDLAPYRNIIREDADLEIGNPELKPATSMNFDVMAEHYLNSVGIISGGVFFKSINDFIYIDTNAKETIIFPGATPADRDTINFKVIQPKNSSETATLFGFEVALQRQLDFLPGVFKNVGFYSNYTFTYSEVKNPNIVKETGKDEFIELPGTAPHTVNVALNYQTSKLTLGISSNYTSAYLDPDELDLTPGLERYYDQITYLDMNGSYMISPQLRIFFEANNLLNSPVRYYAGTSERTYQVEYYDRRISMGFKFDL